MVAVPRITKRLDELLYELLYQKFGIIVRIWVHSEPKTKGKSGILGVFN